jgi:hypothetical protein
VTELGEYLDLLGLAPDENVGLFWKRDDKQHTAVIPCALVEYSLSQISDDYDVYLAPNPTAGPVRYDKGRGKMADVTRVAAVYADLDMKPGACADETVMAEIINDLSGIVGERPVAVIFSGGGTQPIWRLEDCDPKTGAKLLQRFGRLTRIVAETRNAKVDSVFDTARVLRVPGSTNHKYQPPRLAELLPDSGAPMTAEYLDERLNEAGVYDLGDDDELSAEVVADPSDSPWATQTCHYMRELIEAWRTEPVQDRHPWLLCQFVRLECARRYQCLTEADYLRAVSVLTTRFARECARPGDTRTVKRLEVKDIRAEAHARASRKTDAQLSKELGKSGGMGHQHSLESLVAPSVSNAAVVVNLAEPVQDSEPVPGILTAENNFWDSRDSLKEIYDFALSRMCSPWAVLGACAAMSLAWVRPNATLPSLMGGRGGSLNLYVTIAADSGQGKSTAISAAERLMPIKPFRTGVGSGEGLLESFVMRSTEGQEKSIGTKESVLIDIDEFDLLQAMSSRTGSSLVSLLKTGFTGGRLALTYARSKYPVLHENTYRIAIIAAVQPGKAGWIFADSAGGFPQRFMWFPGNDGRIDEDLHREMSYTLGLTLPNSEEFRFPREISIPDETTKHILQTRAKGGRGDRQAGLDTHANFTRLKFAYALTVLDGRFQSITSEDWELSGVAMKVSDITRDWVRQGIRAERDRDAIEYGERQGITRSVAEETRIVRSADRITAVAQRIANKLITEGPMANRDVLRSLGRDHVWADQALAVLKEDGIINSATEQCGPAGSKTRVVWKFSEEGGTANLC